MFLFLVIVCKCSIGIAERRGDSNKVTGRKCKHRRCHNDSLDEGTLDSTVHCTAAFPVFMNHCLFLSSTISVTIGGNSCAEWIGR